MESMRQSLIPPKTISTFAAVMSWTKLWGGSQFIWNGKRRRIRTTKSFFGLGRFAIVVYGWLVFLSYLLIQVVIFGIFEQKPIYWYTRCFLSFIGGQVPLLVMVLLTIREDEIPAWINSALKFDVWFSGKNFGH